MVCTRIVLLPAAALALALPVGAAEHAHQHGVVSLSATLEGELLTLDLDAPLDSLLGFERAPRTAAEREAAAALLQKMNAGQSMWRPSDEARCTLTATRVDAPALQQPAKATGEHADLEATYEFRCAQPAQLSGIVHGLFAAFPRLQRIDWQFALPSGQGKRSITRDQALLPLKR
ncbi:MAG: DUF2796 domain-containing protein [Roseateles sp.]